MHSRNTVVSLVVVCMLLGLATVVAAWPRSAFALGGQGVRSLASRPLPVLLTEDFSSSFAVRPATIIPTGDGSAFLSGLTGKKSHIHWKTWSRRTASAVATIWIDDGIPNEAQGTFHAHRAMVFAFRNHDGRFTRMTVTFRGGDKIWNAGTKLYVEHFGLKKSTPGAYFWG